jgi:hypothetical protein
MQAVTIETKRESLHRFINTIEEKKVEAMYTMFEQEIELEQAQYTDTFKAELDKRYEDYITNGITISHQEANQQIDQLLSTIKH